MIKMMGDDDSSKNQKSNVNNTNTSGLFAEGDSTTFQQSQSVAELVAEKQVQLNQLFGFNSNISLVVDTPAASSSQHQPQQGSSSSSPKRELIANTAQSSCSAWPSWLPTQSFSVDSTAGAQEGVALPTTTTTTSAPQTTSCSATATTTLMTNNPTVANITASPGVLGDGVVAAAAVSDGVGDKSSTVTTTTTTTTTFLDEQQNLTHTQLHADPISTGQATTTGNTAAVPFTPEERKAFFPPWRVALETAIEKNERQDLGHLYASLATIKPFGRPANRAVFFRGFLDEIDDTDLPETGTHLEHVSNVLVFAVDIRSGSIEDLVHGSRFGEVCWFMPSTREQFRISGELHLVASPAHPLTNAHTLPVPFGSQASFPGLDWEKNRVTVWKKLSGVRRASFAWPKSDAHAATPYSGVGEGSLASTASTASTTALAQERTFVVGGGAVTHVQLAGDKQSNIVTHLHPHLNESANGSTTSGSNSGSDTSPKQQQGEISHHQMHVQNPHHHHHHYHVHHHHGHHSSHSHSREQSEEPSQKQPPPTSSVPSSVSLTEDHHPSSNTTQPQPHDTPTTSHHGHPHGHHSESQRQAHAVAMQNFCLLLLDVDGADHLRMNDLPHTRTKYRRAVPRLADSVTSSSSSLLALQVASGAGGATGDDWEDLGAASGAGASGSHYSSMTGLVSPSMSSDVAGDVVNAQIYGSGFDSRRGSKASYHHPEETDYFNHHNNNNHHNNHGGHHGGNHHHHHHQGHGAHRGVPVRSETISFVPNQVDGVVSQLTNTMARWNIRHVDA